MAELNVGVLSSGPRLSRREFLRRTSLLTGAALLGAAGCAPSSKVLNFYNWSNYIDSNTLPDFEKDFGVHVNYDNFSSTEVLIAKMRIGVFGYDLIVATDHKIQELVRGGLIEPLDLGLIPNVKNLYPRFRKGPWDPGNAYSIPWQWGTTGIGYNKKLVKEPVNSWQILWDPKYAGRLSMLDDLRDTIGITLITQGHSGNSTNPAELLAAQRRLIEQRPILKHYSSDTYIDELASNDVWLCEGWSGDVAQAMGESNDIDYVIPDEGSFIWVDNLCIPRGAPHRDIAHQFMNYVLRPDVGANISKAVQYASPNQAAEPFLKDLLADPKVYPPPAIMDKKLAFFADLGPHEDQWQDVWREVKIGADS